MDADADLSDVSDLTSLVDDMSYQDGGEMVARERDESPLTEVEASDDNETAHSGPLTPRRNAQRPTNGLSPSKIGTAIARPVYSTSIRTYAGRRKESRAGTSTKAPETPKASTSTRFPSREDSSLTPLTSPRKRLASVAARRVSSPTKRRRERAGDGDAGAEGAGIELPSIAPSPLSNRRAHRISDNANGVAAHEHGGSLSTPNSRARRQRVPAHPDQSEDSISVPPPSKYRSRKGLKAKEGSFSYERFKPGTLVWIRINAKNDPTEDPLEAAYWWPGRIATFDESGSHVKADVYSPPALNLSRIRVEVPSPSPGFVIPQKDVNITITNFNTPLPGEPSEVSKQSEDDSQIRSRWVEAFIRLAKEDHIVAESPGLMKEQQSEKRETVSRPKSAANVSKGRRIGNASASVPNDDPWRPLSPDETVSIPGELVLAKEKRSKTGFYPAKVIGYVAPSNPKAQPQYVVKFMDESICSITRDMFYTYEEDEFGTCKLGLYESKEVPHNLDTDLNLRTESDAMPTENFIIPDPTLPAPSPNDFYDLPMLDQAAYIIPILQNVMDNKYGPAKGLNDDFLSGGRRREKLMKEAPWKGELTRQEYEELGQIVKSWAFGLKADPQSPPTTFGTNDLPQSETADHPYPLAPRDNLEAPSLPGVVPENCISVMTEGTVETTTSSKDDSGAPSPSNEVLTEPPDNDGTPTLPPSSLPELSPLSSAADSASCVASEPDEEIINDRTSDASKARTFRNLSQQEKINYCTDVLLREAVIQLLLWRASERSDPNLLDDAEEARLHEKGRQLTRNVDFSYQVKELRDKKEKFLRGRAASVPAFVKGTRSRPKYA